MSYAIRFTCLSITFTYTVQVTRPFESLRGRTVGAQHSFYTICIYACMCCIASEWVATEAESLTSASCEHNSQRTADKMRSSMACTPFGEMWVLESSLDRLGWIVFSTQLCHEYVRLKQTSAQSQHLGEWLLLIHFLALSSLSLVLSTIVVSSLSSLIVYMYIYKRAYNWCLGKGKG